MNKEVFCDKCGKKMVDYEDYYKNKKKFYSIPLLPLEMIGPGYSLCKECRKELLNNINRK